MAWEDTYEHFLTWNGKGKWVPRQVGSLVKWAKEHAQTEAFLGIQHYQNKECRYDNPHMMPLCIDVDDPDIEKAWEATKALHDFFIFKGVPNTCIRIFFSGKKGFHIYVSPYPFGIQPAPDLYRQVRHFMTVLGREAGVDSIDMSCYQRRHLLRVPGSYRPDLQRRVIEVDTAQKISEIVERSSNEPWSVELFARRFFTESDSVADLEGWWQDSLRVLSRESQRTIQGGVSAPTEVLHLDGVPSCVDSLFTQGHKENQRNRTTFQIALFAKAAGRTKGQAGALLWKWDKAIPELAEISAEARQEKTKGIVRHVYGDEEAYFSCDAMRAVCHTCPGEGACKWIKQKKDEAPLDVTLSDAVKSEMAGKLIRFKGAVVQQGSQPHLLPAKARIDCSADSKVCDRCAVKTKPEVDLTHPVNIRDMSGMTPKKADVYIQSLKKIPRGCPGRDVEILEYQSVLPAIIAPSLRRYEAIDEEEDDGSLTRNNEILVVKNELKIQGQYEFIGTSLANNKDSSVIHVVDKARELEDIRNIDDISMTAYQEAQRHFSCAPDDCLQKLWDLAEDVRDSKTRVFGRDLHHVMVMLWFHTAITYTSMGRKVDRGWAHILAPGDTAQGKSLLVNSLASYYQAGGRISGEKVSIPGALIGSHMVNGRWVAELGTMARHDCGCVYCEEWQRALIEVRSGMNEPLETGIIMQATMGRAMARARTRMLFMANPISDKGRSLQMSSKAFPCVHARFIMGSYEALRRIDFVLGFKRSDLVQRYMLEAIKEEAKAPIVPQEAAIANRVLCWRRDHNSIYLPKETAIHAVERSEELLDIFECDLNYLARGDAHRNIERFAVAAAQMTWSTDGNGDVIVLPQHVDAVCALFKEHYCSEDVELDQYALMTRGEESFSTNRIRECSGYFQPWVTFWLRAVEEMLIQGGRMSTGNLCDAVNEERGDVLGWLVEAKRRGITYSMDRFWGLTSAGLDAGKKWLNEVSNPTGAMKYFKVNPPENWQEGRNTFKERDEWAD